MKLFTLTAIVAAPFLGLSHSAQALDFTKGDSLPASRSHDWVLGPTGAHGWCELGELGASGTTLPSRQIYITKVNPGTPAAGTLKTGDVILGLGRNKFQSDARISFAKAIQETEASDGKLELLRYRDGRSSTVTLEIGKLPAFSATAPFDCPKSEALLAKGCEAMIKRGLGSPDLDSQINALALLATGNVAYLEAIEEHVTRTLDRPLSAEASLNCWPFSFTNLFLSEYYLATKDDRVLPEIKRLSTHILEGQGPMGTWGHKFANEQSDGGLHGYGAVNAVGIPCAISLVLARECGVQIEGLDDGIEQATTFFRRHINLGTIPYGDGAAQLTYGHDDNGKNSAVAILFALLGDHDATRYYARTALASHNADREQGHTGNFFNMLWSLPAVTLCGPEASGAWLEEFGWYYDLARDPNLRFAYQGYPKEKKNRNYGRWNCPGAYLLHFATPRKKLRITGRGIDLDLGLTTQEIEESIEANNIAYGELSDSEVVKHLASWSPIVRHRAGKEFQKRSTKRLKPDAKSENPLIRIAAVSTSSDLDKIPEFLNDPELPVRVAALKRLAALDKKKAAAAAFYHLADHPEEEPAFTQMLGEYLFHLNTSAKQSGTYLSYPKDREKALIAIERLVKDSDALVASRVAIGLMVLPLEEAEPLFPLLLETARNKPVGNIMFGNKLRLSCTEVLAKYHYREGMELAASLLAEDAWGRNARLPKAASILVQYYQGHAKAMLPIIEKSAEGYEGQRNPQWYNLHRDTIQKIKNAPTPKWELETLTAASGN